MNPPVTFSVVPEASGLRAMLESSVFGMSDMNVMLSNKQVIITLIDPVGGEIGFREKLDAPDSQFFTGFDVSEGEGKMTVRLFLGEAS